MFYDFNRVKDLNSKILSSFMRQFWQFLAMLWTTDNFVDHEKKEQNK